MRGVELSRTGAEHARPRLGLDVFCGQLADAPAEQADIVCFWDTLEHVPDPLLFLREVGRRLAPGGVFALSIPYFSSRSGPAPAVQVVDAEAGAAHLASDAGHPSAGRGAGGPGRHLGDHLAAAAGERGPNRFAGRTGPGDSAGRVVGDGTGAAIDATGGSA